MSSQVVPIIFQDSTGSAIGCSDRRLGEKKERTLLGCADSCSASTPISSLRPAILDSLPEKREVSRPLKANDGIASSQEEDDSTEDDDAKGSDDVETVE
jgi:hypothetical protein